MKNSNDIFKLFLAIAALFFSGCYHVCSNTPQGTSSNGGIGGGSFENAPMENGSSMKDSMLVMLYIGEIEERSSGVDRIDEENRFKRGPVSPPFRIAITANGDEIYNGLLICDYYKGLSGTFSMRNQNSLLKLGIRFSEEGIAYDGAIDLRKGAYLIVSRSGDGTVSIMQFDKQPMFE